MISQEIVEEFFLKMIEELRDNNIPILNDFWENFRNYPRQEELDKLCEKENENEKNEELVEEDLS